MALFILIMGINKNFYIFFEKRYKFEKDINLKNEIIILKNFKK